MTSTASRSAPPIGAVVGRVVMRPLVAGVLLFLVLGGLSFLNDPRGTLSTDVGGKIATLEVMAHHHTIDPDVGYWAARWDPAGTLHGLYNTGRIGDQYVNVTTLPMLVVAVPLYDLGGLRLALALSMLGGVAGAFAARALARRAGADDRRAWAAFWVVGLLSPLTIYSLDLWEHAVGLALMMWGVVAMVDAVERRRWWSALLAGIAFGAAFSMRTEAAAYGFVVVGLGCVVIWRRTSFRHAVGAGLAAAVGFMGLALANTGLEVLALGSSLRAARASGAAEAGGTDVLVRVKEALVTSVGLWPDLAWRRIVPGALAVLLLALAIVRICRGDRGRVPVALSAAAVALFVVRFADGIGFVPGFLVAAPFAIVAVVAAWWTVDQPGRLAAAMTLVALPVVWGFQYSGGATAQWAGRYVLTTTLVLVAVGVVAAARLPVWTQVLLVGLSAAVTVFGLSWMSYRTHEVARAAATVHDLPQPVVISDSGWWLRELGAEYPGSRWLTVTTPEQLARATTIVTDAGYSDFAFVWVDDAGTNTPPQIAGWRTTGQTEPDWLGVPFRITTYQRAGTSG